jgi:hypothetical protein
MATVEQGPASSGLKDRVKNILFTPSAEWDRIDGESATIQGLYTGYACILAAIGPIAALIGGQLFGYGGIFFHVHPSLIGSIVSAIVSYVLSLVGVYVTALIIDALAPNFGGTKNQIQAFKVAVYSSTAMWVAGIFGLFPPVSALGIIGIFSLYLLYLGLPKLMKSPQDKALAYTAVTVVVGIVIWVCIAAVASAIAGAAMFSTGGLAATNVSTPTGTVSVGGTRVDVGKMTAQTAQLQAAAEGKATIQAVPVDVLKGMLPAALPSGYARTEVSGDSGAVGGLQGSSAEAVYTKGDARITLRISDVAAAGTLATLGGALNVNADHQTPTGYEKVHVDGGRMVSEKWDGQSKSGDYTLMIASRFAIEAEGSGAEMSDLKAAAAQVPADRLASLASKG